MHRPKTRTLWWEKFVHLQSILGPGTHNKWVLGKTVLVTLFLSWKLVAEFFFIPLRKHRSFFRKLKKGFLFKLLPLFYKFQREENCFRKIFCQLNKEFVCKHNVLQFLTHCYANSASLSVLRSRFPWCSSFKEKRVNFEHYFFRMSKNVLFRWKPIFQKWKSSDTLLLFTHTSTQYVASFARIRVMSNFSNFKNVSAMIFNLQPNFPL